MKVGNDLFKISEVTYYFINKLMKKFKQPGSIEVCTIVVPDRKNIAAVRLTLLLMKS